MSEDDASNLNTRKVSIVVGSIILGFIALLVLATIFNSDDQTSSRLVGEKAPNVSGVSLNGESVNLEDNDNWTVLNFFALWCTGCIVEHPELVKFDEWGSSTGKANVISVVFDSTDFDQITKFFKDNGGNWPVIDSPSTASDYAVSKIPESFLISPDGRVVKHFKGEVTFDELREAIELNE